MATTESEQFAALLRELKDRSGRSYGVLAGKLHMSTSTLHRYCNGDAVPNEYAPVERLARLCGATPEESVELHRRWILADEARRRSRGANPAPMADTPSGPGPEPTSTPAAVPDPAPDAEAADRATPEPAVENGPAQAPPAKAEADAESGAGPSGGSELPAVGPAAPPATKRMRGFGDRLGTKKTRLVLIGAAVVALAVPVTAVATLSGGPDGSDTVADATTSTPEATNSARPSPSSSPSASTPGSPSPSSSPSPSASKDTKKHAPPEGVPLSVGISSYDWETPCGKFFLLDQKPGAVPPPPTNEQDRRSWARALNGVDGGGLKLELTATGKSQDSVVITGINVRVVGRSAPLNWTAYSMGSGCGSGIMPQSFDFNLDAAQPVSKPVAGQQADKVVPAKDFPFKVSTTDPEVFDLNLHTDAHDVSWYLEVAWSSGERSGRIPVYDNGKPFRTSAVKGRPAYEYRLDTNVWDHLDAG
ncbi:helix-turn-helix domain-containing protein [Streptomyces sp. NBC_01431]|uniref:helix-turn-helix domain-containing protein n=1 Tax=Streptomyces sp. NBC_01431 TaxID=2903863 RepID=UPI002E3531CF|nr:helix-turn-helix domain-containing protein [Streptomyces sp. NBC_01431]